MSEAKVNTCKDREREALLQFKGGVVDDFGILSSWGNSTGEDKRDCCINWRGVECDNHTGHVISLDLHGHLSYYMGYQYVDQDLGGKIGTSLAELQHLKHLNLSHNHFDGILPTQLGNLSNLQSLDLSFNRFEGSFPAQLIDLFNLQSLDLSANHFEGNLLTHFGNLSNLQFLDLSWNYLEGSLPTQLGNLSNLQSLHLGSVYGNISCENLDWLSGLPLLRELDLSWVNLSKAIHWQQAINKLPSLSELYLSYTRLPPIIPTIPISITLTVLVLSGNGLTSSIFPWFFNLSNTTSLDHLGLSYNNLNGSIPDAFGNMTTLAYLYLSFNQLEGEIPKSLRDLCHLHKLYLNDNNLTGLLEKDFLACSNNTLEALNLSNNRFRGTSFPHFSGFSQLRDLRLGFNQLNGTLPESIGQLPQLELLDISTNSLQGIVSENHLFGLSKLNYLDLSYNSKLTINISSDQVPLFQADCIVLASCKFGPRFPNWLQTQNKLATTLDISASGILDVIPSWFWNLTSGLETLNISNNQIRGRVPNLTSYPSYFLMDMSSNCFQGSVPQSLFNVAWLDLSNNMFSGSISLSCTTTHQYSLSYLDLSNNRLSGELPICWVQWKYLNILNLANNNLSGKIKNSIGLLRQMKSLHLRNNSFTGALPSSLKNCRDLHLIDLGKNNLSGKIPAWMGESLPRLIVFDLRSNKFSGKIPSSLCQLKNIQVLELSNNNLSGTIPKCLNNLTAMAHKGSLVVAYDEKNLYRVLGYYIDNAWVQWKGKEAKYKKTLGLLRSIDFSNNKLTGEIPSEVTDLVELVALNMSRNNLIGPIPSTIGQLKSLDFLDLSQNRLNGGIPNSLAQIARLSVLDLSNNNLSGRIPLGTQLQSFNASTYEENPGLCGPPLLKLCQEDEGEPGEFSFTGFSSKNDDIQNDASDIWFYGNIVLGFIIGFWGVCGSLLLNSSWRNVYFQFLNKMKDQLHVITTINMNRLQRSFQS